MQPPASLPTRSEAEGERRSLTSSRYGAILLLAACAATLAMRWPGLALPLERDEGAYASVAALWREGWLPYRDVFDHKPPLLYLLYMPAALFGPPGARAIRLWLMLYFLLQLPLVFALARRIWEPVTAGLATVLYAIAGSAFSLQGLILNSEQALVLPALVALWSLFRAIQADRLHWPLVYGVCLGLISLIKPTAVPLLLPLAMLGARGSLARQLLHVAVAGGSAAATWLPVLAVWGASGGLDDLGFALFTYNRIYAAESWERWSAGGVVDVLAPFGALLLCALAGARLSVAGDVQRRQRLAVVLWTAAMLGAALLSLRAFIHYYYPVLPGLALLAAPTITDVLSAGQRASRAAERITMHGARVLLLGVLVVPFVLDNLRLVRMSAAEQAEALYGSDGRDYFAAAAEVAATIRAATDRDERIFVWASEPEIYFLSGRAPAARYIYDYPLQLLPRAREEVVHELRRDPPAVFVAYHQFVPEELRLLAEAGGLRMLQTIGGYDIWATPEGAAR